MADKTEIETLETAIGILDGQYGQYTQAVVNAAKETLARQKASAQGGTLMPCPFCGGEAVKADTIEPGCHGIMCSYCKANAALYHWQHRKALRQPIVVTMAADAEQDLDWLIDNHIMPEGNDEECLSAIRRIRSGLRQPGALTVEMLEALKQEALGHVGFMTTEAFNASDVGYGAVQMFDYLASHDLLRTPPVSDAGRAEALKALDYLTEEVNDRPGTKAHGYVKTIRSFLQSACEDARVKAADELYEAAHFDFFNVPTAESIERLGDALNKYRTAASAGNRCMADGKEKGD